MSAQYPPQPRPAPIPQPQLAPSGQTPGSYTEAFRGREAHTKFADPCEIARQVRLAFLERFEDVETRWGLTDGRFLWLAGEYAVSERQLV